MITTILTTDTHTDFSTLLTNGAANRLLEALNALADKEANKSSSKNSSFTIDCSSFDADDLKLLADDDKATTALIQLFNQLFVDQQVELVRGAHEPEYFPANNGNLARIEFAHGFFNSALHEISHWCIAGQARRQLSDFGYWYAADGRSEAQQHAFERVEVKPQALECLFTLACQRPFQVSQDNLFAEFDTSRSTFASDVYRQAQNYIAQPQSLPRDAQTLLKTLLSLFADKDTQSIY
ncbi:elongation factor P hydroxylase [uncultured Psychrobacter sp.]|jgi:elongation factor P hydroxylase|uniref:elongation factor P hydroxylase n=1 Tax=uncultured Psychrobacter sp. TaxID=259303 RepID=UPI000C8DBE59|nr:elongation factor P hydroxylase [uncultured Psychrobacter sp.]MAF75935.1 ATPase [Idiomarinaceae bacterium]